MSKPIPLEIAIEIVTTYDSPLLPGGSNTLTEAIAEIEVKHGYKCSECEEIAEGSADVPLYECGACGDVFAGTEGNRCPNCNKFASRSADLACSVCEAGEANEVYYVECPFCNVAVVEEDFTDHIQGGCG